jgi:shikimate 5-dehydrogenase
MTYGLIGYPITHSFSQPYFTDKFAKMGLADTHRYFDFPMENFQGFDKLKATYPDLKGLNVTIPHKQNVLPFLDRIDPAAKRIGAVNCIRIEADGTTTGYNTDYVPSINERSTCTKVSNMATRRLQIQIVLNYYPVFCHYYISPSSHVLLIVSNS